MKYIKSYEEFERLNKALHSDGAFLVVKDKKGKVNVMTIGWAMIGVVWGKPMMTVFVRPARYTHELICVCPEHRKDERRARFLRYQLRQDGR